MKSKNFVEWDPQFALGIPVIDSQHMQLIELTKKLHESCLAGSESATEQFIKTTHAAVDYVRYHFTTEETLLTRIGYPDYAAHKKEHEKFVLEILRQVKAFEEGKRFVPRLFVLFLRDWVLGHIAVSDKAYALYMQSLKRDGKLAAFPEKLRHLLPK
jgi:hemerythrin